MATKKPRKLCRLVEGRAIGNSAHRSFADTFNWLVSCWDNLTGATGVDDGKPVIDTGENEPTGGFRYVDGYIREGVVMVGRQAVRVAATGASDGEWRVAVDLESQMAHIEMGSGFEPPSGAISYIPLFVITEGKITTDYRGATTVQSWE